MLFPIGDEDRRTATPWVTYTLIGVNIVVYLGTLPFMTNADLFRKLALVPAHPTVFTLFSHMFMHASLLHIGGNMIFLWIFGDNMERLLGPWLFAAVYLALGLAAGLGECLVRMDSYLPAIGASGAIAGVLAMYLVCFPKNRVNLFYFVLFDAGVLKVRAYWFLLMWILLNVFEAVLQTPGVAHGAHVGGFAAGGIVGLLISHVGPWAAQLKDDAGFADAKEMEFRGEMGLGDRRPASTGMEAKTDIYAPRMLVFNERFVAVQAALLNSALRDIGDQSAMLADPGEVARKAMFARNISPQKAQKLAAALHVHGVNAAIIPVLDEVDFPPTEIVNGASVSEDGLSLSLESGLAVLVPFDRLYMMNAGVVLRLGRNPAAAPVAAGGRALMIVDFFQFTPWTVYRWVVRGNSLAEIHAPLPLIDAAAAVLKSRPIVARSPEIDVLVRAGIVQKPVFASLGEFDEYSRWLLLRMVMRRQSAALAAYKQAQTYVKAAGDMPSPPA
jgi:membrane associated rhomboid family serine protease